MSECVPVLVLVPVTVLVPVHVFAKTRWEERTDGGEK